jgi:hypothetical protein
MREELRVWLMEDGKYGMTTGVVDGQAGGDFYCSQCRKPNNTRATFCPHCGVRMQADAATVPSPPSYREQKVDMLPANYLQGNTGQQAQRTVQNHHQPLNGYDKNKVVGLLLTFFFPCFGFLYSTNYVWAVFALFIDVVNFFLLFLFGFGLVTGLLWRLLALVISNHGIDRYRYRKSIDGS